MGRGGLHQLGMRLSSVCLGVLLSIFATRVVQAAPVNDNFASATVLTGDTNFVTAFNVDATAEPGEPDHADTPGGKSVWWSWQAPFTGSVSISTVGTKFDTVLAVYTGDLVSNLQVVAANDDAEGLGFGSVVSAVVFRALAGETYHIAVDGFNGASGAINLSVGPTGIPAPEWSLLDLDGHLVTSADFPNKVLVIDFWETICGACVEELPDLLGLQRDYSPQGFTILGVSKDDKAITVRQYVETNAFNYDIAMTTATLEESFGGNIALPTKFVIDRENKLVATHVGGGDRKLYESILRPLLRGSTHVPLVARRVGAAIVLAWPATEFGYRLEVTDSLGGGEWMEAPFPVVTTSSENTVTVPFADGNRFYRLHQVLSNQ